MQTLAEELEIIIAATALIFVITSFVAVFLVIHQRRSGRHLRERKEMEEAFEKESLRAELEVKENTLNTIAQEIHDNIGQLLSLVKLNLNTLESDSSDKLTTTRELVAKAIDELRNLSKTLNSEYVKNESLQQSLEAEFSLIKKLGSHDVDFTVIGTEKQLPPDKQLIIFRIAQECITNIVKHANAKRIECQIAYDPYNLKLIINDNGDGFDNEIDGKTNKVSGTGLRNLHYRTNLIGGLLQVDSNKGIGTSISLTVPLA